MNAWIPSVDVMQAAAAAARDGAMAEDAPPGAPPAAESMEGGGSGAVLASAENIASLQNMVGNFSQHIDELRTQLERHGELPLPNHAPLSPASFLHKAVDSMAEESGEEAAVGDARKAGGIVGEEPSAGEQARAGLLLRSVPVLTPEAAADLAIGRLMQEHSQTGGIFLFPEETQGDVAQDNTEGDPAPENVWRTEMPEMTPGQSDLAADYQHRGDSGMSCGDSSEDGDDDDADDDKGDAQDSAAAADEVAWLRKLRKQPAADPQVEGMSQMLAQLRDEYNTAVQHVARQGTPLPGGGGGDSGGCCANCGCQMGPVPSVMLCDEPEEGANEGGGGGGGGGGEGGGGGGRAGTAAGTGTATGTATAGTAAGTAAAAGAEGAGGKAAAPAAAAPGRAVGAGGARRTTQLRPCEPAV
eukprot:SAG11_NODE_608_length_8226_cov_4.489603_6_plen_414_part_00